MLLPTGDGLIEVDATIVAEFDAGWSEVVGHRSTQLAVEHVMAVLANHEHTSLDREALFHRAAVLLGVTYNVMYNRWFDFFDSAASA